ncbi:hypothetical protein FAGAP_988 [Fusarium agapanthi]|uniref:CHAT domain-containing protein n=1 Tax=Fusarium agapanthi TaxID=1803897 RepID=A0A9P5EI23_9HYPO|nr:hypothetical protein FAGAP_988 [Fusarium agapanthi]
MTDRIHTVPLVDLSWATVEQKILNGERGSPDVLEWLWDTIFPLHAAGYHRKRTKETILDRVVLSYASSVKALIQARKRRTLTRETNKAVLVAMETTPTLSRLAFANQELEAVKDVCASMGLGVVEPERRKAALIEQLHQCKFFHLAGHGCTDPQAPLRSYLYLEDVMTNPLRVGGLLDLNLKDQPPPPAYLSACGTGRIQQEQFMDESVHLISALMMFSTIWLSESLWSMELGGKEDEFGVEQKLKACRDLWGQGGRELRPRQLQVCGVGSFKPLNAQMNFTAWILRTSGEIDQATLVYGLHNHPLMSPAEIILEPSISSCEIFSTAMYNMRI